MFVATLRGKGVLILVLMEDTLRVRKQLFLNTYNNSVLILVLMEDTLRAFIYMDKRIIIIES